MKLSIHRLHPNGCRIVPAEKTLQGSANPGGVKWCGPFSSANKIGWWVHSPVDIDILWKGGETFEHKLYTPYSDYDHRYTRQLVRPEDGVDPDKWCMEGGRTKLTWGAADAGVVQIWTGCIFKTPPGWCLHVRSPVNFEPLPFHIQEGILETDWMQYDIWLNVKFHKKHHWASLRRDGPPIAQLVPTRREAYEQSWETEDVMLTRDTEEGEKVTAYWLQYNRKKYESGGKQRLSAADPTITKDSTTYFRERKEALKCPMGH
jgi:hypothetical protein